MWSEHEQCSQTVPTNEPSQRRDESVYVALFYAYDAAVLPVLFDSGVNPIRLNRALTIFLSTVEMIFDCPDSMNGNMAVFQPLRLCMARELPLARDRFKLSIEHHTHGSDKTLGDETLEIQRQKQKDTEEDKGLCRLWQVHVELVSFYFR